MPRARCRTSVVTPNAMSRTRGDHGPGVTGASAALTRTVRPSGPVTRFREPQGERSPDAATILRYRS